MKKFQHPISIPIREIGYEDLNQGLADKIKFYLRKKIGKT
jgi:hypothetical protein